MDNPGIASAGIQTAIARLEASAQRTANAPLQNLAKGAVERVQAQVEIEVNARLVRAADDMTGMLLDTLA